MRGTRFVVVVATWAVLMLGAWNVTGQPVGHALVTGRVALDIPRAPLINEISPVGSAAAPAWVELRNPLDREIDVSGLVLGFSVNTEYTLPGGIPPIPEQGFLQIKLDRDGSDTAISSMSVSSGHMTVEIAVVHLPQSLTEAWRPNRGMLAVYRPLEGREDTVLADFVAWGAPARGGWTRRHLRTLWPLTAYAALVENAGLYDPHSALQPGHSIGLLPGMEPGVPAHWAVYSGGERSPGTSNPLPRPRFFTPPNGTAVRQQDLLISWRARTPEERYEIQFSTSRDFSTDLQTFPLEAPFFRGDERLGLGSRFYRVRRFPADTPTTPETASLWSLTGSIAVRQTTCGDGATLNLAENSVLDFDDFRYQRKDTRLLCLDQCDSTRRAQPHRHHQMAPAFVPNSCGPGPSVEPDSPPHGDDNCVRACISMMVSHHGKCLSQDRIAFFTNGGGADPVDDVGHWDAMYYSPLSCTICGISPGGEITKALTWALGIDTVIDMAETQLTAAGTIPQLPDNVIGFSHWTGWVQFNIIQQWIDSGRPIMTRSEDCKTFGNNAACTAHARVISGYCVDPDGDEWLYIFDPDAGPQWQTYCGWLQTSEGLWVGPVKAPNARNDEESIWIDADEGVGDGVMDFDEIYRFLTNPANLDSDGDGIGDLTDIVN